MEFQIISILRPTPTRHLTNEEIRTIQNLAKDGLNQAYLGNGEEIRIHTIKLEAFNGEEAMQTYHLTHGMHEILSCEPA